MINVLPENKSNQTHEHPYWRVIFSVKWRTHTEQKYYLCSHCEIYLAQKGNLTAHMKTHTEEKPFHGSQCEKAISTNGYLSKHMGIHTGEK